MPGPSCSPSSASAFTKRCSCIAKSSSTPTASSRVSSASIASSSSTAGSSDLVAPEYAELVGENLRRRLAGSHGAERFEVEMVGLQGQVSLLELTTAQIDFEGAPALLVTGVEVIPTKKLRALASGKLDEKEAAARAAMVAPPLPPPPPAPAAAAGLRHAVARRGHRHHRHRRAARVPEPGRRETSRRASRAQAVGRPLEDVVGLVDQNDRKQLADPVQGSDRRRQRQPAQSEPPGRAARQALGGGARHRARRIAVAR